MSADDPELDLSDIEASYQSPMELERLPLPPLPMAVPVQGTPEPLPPRTPEHFVCLRGPCRHYWHIVTMANAGNVDGVFRQHTHTCMRVPVGGDDADLTDNNVYECNQWDPIESSDAYLREQRREQFFKLNPTCRPAAKKVI